MAFIRHPPHYARGQAQFIMNLHGSKFLVAVIFLLFIIDVAHAGNPLYMNADGQPLVWNTHETIRYKVDPKGLGSLDYNQSLALVQQAMNVWEAVTDTGIEFEYLGPLDEEITLDNWEILAGNYIYAEAYGITHSGTSASQEENYLVIGFDNTGEIVSAKGNSGASGVESLTGVSGTYDDPGYIISAHLFINGLYHNGTDDDIDDVSLTDVMAILVHELGHVLGLDHSLFHYEMYQDIISNRISVDYSRYLPTMFPRFIESTGKHFINLHPDDIATVQWMYDANNQLFSGEVLDSQNNPQDTLLVTVRNVASPLCEAFSQATSITCSDMNSTSSGDGNPYFNGKFCMDENSLGIYEIPVLETGGSYTLDVQEIPDDFVSSIAKFDSNVSSISGAAEFYNQNDDSDDEAEDFTVIDFDGSDSESRDIILSDNPSIDMERIDYSFFEDADYFSEIFVEDDLCPIENDFDVDLAISNSANTEIGSNETTTTSTSAGCSLNSNPETHQNPVFFLVVLLPLILLRRVIRA